MRCRRIWGVLAALWCGLLPAAAQYYSWGSDAPMRWSSLRTDGLQVLAPDTALRVGREALYYAGIIRGEVGYGFTHGPLAMPFVLHPENFEPNGLTMYLPRRIDLRTVPQADGYAVPWVKHLVAHEFRHAVQYNNLNRGLFRVLRFAAGEQASAVSLLFMPLWAMEGDATLAETEMFTFGRGLQPSFSMGYRAMGRVGTDPAGSRYRRNPDKWFCGSFRDYIPDHYQLGYQISAYAYDRYGENIWDKVVARAVRRPYYFATTHFALKKYYDTSVNALFRETFDRLQAYWDALPPAADSAQPLVGLPEGNYTVYRWPLPLDGRTLLAVKEDFDRPARFVRIDSATGREEEIARTGVLSSRPVVADGRLWWSEFRRSKLFEERINSQLCYLDLDAAHPRPHTVDSLRNALYPTPLADRLAWAEHRPDGTYAVADSRGGRLELPAGTELHGLAWDRSSASLYGLVTDDSGMWIARIAPDGLHPVTQGSYTTLSDLRSDGNGRLYFGSIASGKDEAFVLDLEDIHPTEPARNATFRVTGSRYGAFAPAPLPGAAAVVVTTYDRLGYRPALQPLDSLRPTPWAPVPADAVNPPRKRWPVANLDTVRFTPADELRQAQAVPARRYRKALHALHVHSWMPAAFNPFEAVDEHKVDVNIGATLLSQNLLSNTDAFAYYGWNAAEGSLVKAGLRYTGWGVQLGLTASYGGDRMVYRLSTANPDPEAENKTLYQPLPQHKRYYALEAAATLPLVFQRGYHTRRLTLSVAWNYSNGAVADLGAVQRDEAGRIANLDAVGYRYGLNKIVVGVSLSDQVRMAHRDFLPRFAWQLLANWSVNPTNRDYSQLAALYGHVYLPGVAPHHALQLAASFQTSVGGARFAPGYRPLSYRSTLLIPVGFASSAIQADRYRAFGANYQLPVAYPDGGICSVLYIKRIRLNLGGQFARFRVPAGDRMGLRDIWSAGGDLIFDFNLFRLPANATSTFKLSVYHPSSGGVWVGGAVGLPF